MSIFYEAQYGHLFPVPLIVLERLEALRDRPPQEVVSSVLSECCGLHKPTDAQIAYFLERISKVSEAANQAAEQTNKSQNTSTTKTIGSSLSKFIGGLDSAQVLLWACGYDYQKAKYWYTQVDLSIAQKAIETFISIQSETNQYLYEANLYGFGGRYNGDDQEQVIDLSKADARTLRSVLTGKRG